MLISIILPTYNYGRYIEETLQSLNLQTYRNWECIVIDDGSTDDTRQRVESLARSEPRINYVYQKNSGVAAARNNGIKRAKGDYIQFLDADDLLESDKLERHADFLDSNPEIGLVYSEVRYFRTGFPTERLYSMMKQDREWMPKLSGQGDDLVKAFVTRNILTVNAPMLRKSVVELVGDFSSDLVPVEDWDYWLRCAMADVRMRFLEAENTRALIRIHPASLTKRKDLVTRQHIRIRQHFDRILIQPALKRLNRQLLVKYKCYQGKRKIVNGEFLSGLKQTGMAICRNPITVSQMAFERLMSRAK